MADFLTTKSIQSNIESIIAEAKNKIVIVSPFIKLSDYFMDSLTHAARRGVVIKILYGKSDLHPTVLGNISKLKNVEVYYFEHLHAKCYLNESKMVITSMNLYDASEKNREMGVLVQRNTDKELFDKALYEIQLILDSPQTSRQSPAVQKESSFVRKNNSSAPTFSKGNKTPQGHCIRCGTSINFNPERPFCSGCYSKWAQHGNPFYEENFCHNCGDDEPTSMEKPQCYDCYQVYLIDEFDF